jgi:hypothetical protein
VCYLFCDKGKNRDGGGNLSSVVAPSVFKTVTGLGEPIGVYKSDRQKIRFRYIVIIAGALPFLGLALWELHFHPELSLPSVGLIILVLVGMLAVGRRAGGQWKDVAVVYFAGLAYFNGKTILVFKWDEIAAITVDITGTSHGKFMVATVHNYTITHQNGKQLTVNKMILRSGELCDQVRGKTFPHIMARSRQAFLYGKLVRFGAFAMGKEQGILAGEKSLPWRDVGQVSLERRQVVVKPKRGRKLKAMSAQIPGVLNLDVFLALAEEMTAEYG